MINKSLSFGSTKFSEWNDKQTEAKRKRLKAIERDKKINDILNER